MFYHEIEKRVRYGETDKMGYLYYGNYAQYYEIGRVEALRSLGITYKDLEDVHGIWLPVMSMESRFVRPAYYDELLIIRTELRRMPTHEMIFHTEIKNEKGKLVNGATVKLCYFEAATKKTIPIPDILQKVLQPYFQIPESD